MLSFKPCHSPDRRAIAIFQLQRKAAKPKQFVTALFQIFQIFNVNNICTFEQLLMTRQICISNWVQPDHIEANALKFSCYYIIQYLFINTLKDNEVTEDLLGSKDIGSGEYMYVPYKLLFHIKNSGIDYKDLK